MNVEIGAEAALFPEKEYINGIAVAVCKYLFKNSIFFSVPDVEENAPQGKNDLSLALVPPRATY
jgi:hypothetical protein